MFAFNRSKVVLIHLLLARQSTWVRNMGLARFILISYGTIPSKVIIAWKVKRNFCNRQNTIDVLIKVVKENGRSLFTRYRFFYSNVHSWLAKIFRVFIKNFLSFPHRTLRIADRGIFSLRFTIISKHWIVFTRVDIYIRISINFVVFCSSFRQKRKKKTISLYSTSF